MAAGACHRPLAPRHRGSKLGCASHPWRTPDARLRRVGNHATTISLKRFSYRFAEQVLNSNLSLKNEVESVLLDKPYEVAKLGREHFNGILKERSPGEVEAFGTFWPTLAIFGLLFCTSNRSILPTKCFNGTMPSALVRKVNDEPTKSRLADCCGLRNLANCSQINY